MAALPAPGAGKSATEVPLLGMYFGLRDRMSTLEPMLCEFYLQLIRKLGLVHDQTLLLDGLQQMLTEGMLQDDMKSVLAGRAAQENPEDYTLFKGHYIRLFADGSVLQKIMYHIFEHLGETKIVWIRWKSEYRLNNKSLPKLRTFYRFIDTSFVCQLPVDPCMAFTVDALLYCEWRCNHPNLIGFNMVMLAWMLNEPAFNQFIPASIKSSKPIANRLLKFFWSQSGISFSLTTNPQRQTVPAAAKMVAAKTVAAKSAPAKAVAVKSAPAKTVAVKKVALSKKSAK